MNLIIGYVGRAFAGKDTCSKELKQLFIDTSATDKIIDPVTRLIGEKLVHIGQEMIFWHLPLALAVKMEFVEEQAEKGIQISLEGLLYDEHYKNNYRADLIRIGDGRRETIDPLYWIEKVKVILAEIEKRFPQYISVFQVTDMRYENEVPEFEKFAELRGDLNMLSIKVNTELATVLARMPAKNAISYAKKYRLNKSERNIKRIAADIEVDNNSSIENLQKQIKALILPVIRAILSPEENEPK